MGVTLRAPLSLVRAVSATGGASFCRRRMLLWAPESVRCTARGLRSSRNIRNMATTGSTGGADSSKTNLSVVTSEFTRQASVFEAGWGQRRCVHMCLLACVSLGITLQRSIGLPLSGR